MRQEDKELLLKDLSARLPYGIKCQVETISGERNILLDYMNLSYIFKLPTDMWKDCKPYLRPMSSMTEEEKEEMHNLLSPEGTAIYKSEGIAIPFHHCGDWVPYEFMNRIIEYLNTHHFDYRGLIDKGLAIAVTKENNPYET